MANESFEFKQFTIHQQRCAMKVGTDGTLLGAWAQAPAGKGRILDIGTGTGLIALMMAQRFPETEVLGVDIDAETVGQARENIMASPFADRIVIREADARSLEDDKGFDAIVCNPPFFMGSLICPKEQRTIARHTVSLTYGELAQSAFRLLRKHGKFSMVIPAENYQSMEAETWLAGFFPSRICSVRTMPEKPPKRCLIEFSKTPVYKIDMSEEILNIEQGVRSLWYQQLTQEFYLR